MNKDIVDEIHIYLQHLQKENSQHNNEIALHKKQEDIEKLYYEKLYELQKKTENRNALNNQIVELDTKQYIQRKQEMELELNKQLYKQQQRIDRTQRRIVNHKKIRWGEKERKNLLDIRIKQIKELNNQQERLHKRLNGLNITNTIEHK